jgi:hypothetical protein
MGNVSTELLKLELHAQAVLAAMPELREADSMLVGFEKLESINDICKRYGLMF